MGIVLCRALEGAPVSRLEALKLRAGLQEEDVSLGWTDAPDCIIGPLLIMTTFVSQYELELFKVNFSHYQQYWNSHSCQARRGCSRRSALLLGFPLIGKDMNLTSHWAHEPYTFNFMTTVPPKKSATAPVRRQSAANIAPRRRFPFLKLDMIVVVTTSIHWRLLQSAYYVLSARRCLSVRSTVHIPYTYSYFRLSWQEKVNHDSFHTFGHYLGLSN